jgi:hypothetical protein
MAEAWNIHNDATQPIPARDLAAVLAMAEACQQQIPVPPGTWVHRRTGPFDVGPQLIPADDGLREYRDAIDWYVRGGFDSINPILRRRDPSRLRLASHRNDQWLRERVRKDVRLMDEAPHIVLDHDVTLYRGIKYARSRRPLAAGQLLADRALTSCSMRSDVAEQAALRYVAREDYRPYFDVRLAIRVPAGTPMLPIYWYALRGGQTSLALEMEINEAEVILPRNVDLRIERVRRTTKAGVIEVRAVCEARPTYAPSSDILPSYADDGRLLAA